MNNFNNKALTETLRNGLSLSKSAIHLIIQKCSYQYVVKQSNANNNRGTH